ncbi:MAG: hypothetical protein AABP62_09975 [Planctomycetota bacterium]
MPGFRSYCSAKNLAVMAGLGVLCLPLWLSLIPNIEESREEARTAWAFLQAKRIHSEIAKLAVAAGAELPPVGPLVEPATVVTGLPEVDPWGQPFQLVSRSDDQSHIVRVFSFGPDASSGSEGLDPDDISSDMSVRPTKPFEIRRRRQWLVAFGVSGGVWFTASWLYFAAASRKNEHSNSPR